MPEIRSQELGEGEDELSVRQRQQEPLVQVLREQKGPFLRAGRAEINRLAGERPEVFILAVGIGALDTSDASGVVTAKNELLNHLGDPLDTESAVDSSVFAFILFHDALKMLFKQHLKVIDTARPVHPLGDRCDRKG